MNLTSTFGPVTKIEDSQASTVYYDMLLAFRIQLVKYYRLWEPNSISVVTWYRETSLEWSWQSRMRHVGGYNRIDTFFAVH
jgi:hypothetical protein